MITWSLHTGPRDRRLSKAQELVVPRVAIRQKGINPLALSSAMAEERISPVRLRMTRE